jgi:hypothetical protein
VKVAHPLMLRAIDAAKKNDRSDAGKVADSCCGFSCRSVCRIVGTPAKNSRTVRFDADVESRRLPGFMGIAKCGMELYVLARGRSVLYPC